LKILAIGAHFDDVEIGCGGTLAKHVAMGDEVIALVVTNSYYTSNDGKIIRERDIALQEGLAAAKIIGFKEFICADMTTLELSFNNQLVRMINNVVDDYEIEMIYTHWDRDVHQDHQAIGLATLAAGRKVNRLLMYRSNLYASSQEFHSNFYVDISDYLDTKMTSIAAHQSEVAKFGPGWTNFWLNEARNNGQRMGVEYAEAFQLVKYLM
jgi:LmbE family N-acetylglucosaminyl deacetylase